MAQSTEAASVTHGQLVGTPSYMAPEQLRGEALDSRVNQFGWGVTAYELLSGRKPWLSEGGGLHLLAEESSLAIRCRSARWRPPYRSTSQSP